MHKLPIVPFDVAEDLKELGFDWSCSQHYNDAFDGDIRLQDFSTLWTYPAPEQASVAKWLRDVHDINLFVHQECIGSDEFCYTYEMKYLPKEFADCKRKATKYIYVQSFCMGFGSYSGGWDNYEEAELEGIREAIKYLKNEI